MPDRKRRPAKRTTAKRTPAKKAAAKKPAVPVEETVTEDVATPEEESTPDEQAPADESGEATDAVESVEPSDAPSDDPDEAPDEAEGESDASQEPGEPEAAEDGPQEPADATGDEANDVEEAEAREEPAPDPRPGEAEPVEPVETAEPAAETAEEPAEVDAPEEKDTPGESDEVAEVAAPIDAAEDEEPAMEPEEPEEPAPLVGRARLFDALTHFRRGQVAVAVLLCILGYAAVVQVQTNTEDSTYAGLREQELIDILSGLAGTTQKAQEQIEELEATRDELEDQTLQQQTALQRAEEQVDTLRVIAGTVPVSGPGITIEIDPGADPLRLTALLDLIEELRTSGAEAMEIEGADGEAVRLVASSSIEVSQPTPGLNVGGELISPPYRLQVIGPPDTLAGAIDFYQGPQDQLEEQGAEVDVESEEKIDIESIHTVSR
ncbi:DUF881 domain-containing protein [Nocardioides albus]|uniref:Uncharacterized protein YlxW (UPF0749 family) n=1 Tax=Nocardioides albus TaxID=1841 RepID=A0A7W5A8C2_9ACTN|nr:DUF881 domain-containing protein [Nocardioides albus]MBB3091235.1 uncharacterized protein YlxW (UPF0749 family) [Nocardioides albus]GGU33386.1 hypothetical protein GCM10007979_35480 [Nocardioides albus]